MGKKVCCENLCIKNGQWRCVKKDVNSCGCRPWIQLPHVEQLLSEEQLKKRLETIGKIQGAIKEGNTALVLGAGVSIPAGLPNWVGLVSKMMGHAIQYSQINEWLKNKPEEKKIKENDVRLTDALIRGELCFLNGINVLESGEYIQQRFDDPVLPDKLRDQLPGLAMKGMISRMVDNALTYEELLAKCFCRQSDKPVFADVQNGDKARKNEILKEWMEKMINDPAEEKRELRALYNKIAGGIDLTKEKTKKQIAELNTIFAVAYLAVAKKGIHNVMTYNYDPLIQEYMIELFGIDKESVITYTDTEGWERRINIDKEGEIRKFFHVHGFVPRECRCKNNLPENESAFPAESDSLILSEDSYYDVEQNGAYNWSSSVQAYFLNKHQCIFVGFSAEDYNFKRILRQQGMKHKGYESFRGEGKYHYLIYTIDDLVKNIYMDVCRYHLQRPEKKACSVEGDTKILLRHVLNSKKKYWKRFGICPVWVTVDEIPELLAGLI